jgi:hypothetical protein
MDRSYYFELARGGLCMPIGRDLLLHENVDAEFIRTDGKRLASVIVETAHRYRTPLALPLMDLMREKAAMLQLLGIDDAGGEYHFSEAPEGARPGKNVPMRRRRVSPRKGRSCAELSV